MKQASGVAAASPGFVFRDGYEDPAADLDGTPHMSGPFSEPWAPNLFDLEPRFRDGLDALAAAGATAVIQPGGSMRDAEVIAAADEHDIAMVFTGRRHFRH